MRTNHQGYFQHFRPREGHQRASPRKYHQPVKRKTTMRLLWTRVPTMISKSLSPVFHEAVVALGRPVRKVPVARKATIAASTLTRSATATVLVEQREPTPVATTKILTLPEVSLAIIKARR